MSDFWSGFLVGVGAAGLFGLVLQQFRLSRKKWQAMTRPQKVEVATSKTPWQVTFAGLEAGCLIVVGLLLIGVVLWLMLASPI
jgi:hypothetical protein